jgi:hypothetical protein
MSGFQSFLSCVNCGSMVVCPYLRLAPVECGDVLSETLCVALHWHFYLQQEVSTASSRGEAPAVGELVVEGKHDATNVTPALSLVSHVAVLQLVAVRPPHWQVEEHSLLL